MELQKGRPADTAGRLEKEIRTYDLLDRLGVAYERVCLLYTSDAADEL